jgi:hypothetical protein
MLAITSTNASVQYWLLSTSGETAALSSLTWGPNTSYPFTALNNQGVGTTGSVTAFIDYLDPSATYYYHVRAWTSCTDSSGTHQYRGDYYGSWTEAADPSPAPFNYYIQGTVKDANGAPAPANIFVQATCVDGGGGFGNGTKTNSAGHYSMNLLNANWCSNHGGYVVQVRNQVLNVNGGYSSQWGGRWNETFAVWAPQIVNFVLPVNSIGPYLPEELEFTNSPYVTLGFSETVGVTTTYTSTAAGNGQNTTTSFSASNSGSATGANVETWVKYYCSGSVEFNAITTRQASILGVNFYGAIQSSTTASLASDPMSPSSIPQSEAYDNGLWYSYSITSGQTRGGSVTISGSATSISGLDISVDIGLDIAGVGSVGASIPILVSISTTTSYSNAFSFSVDNTASVTHTFRAYVQGGSDTETGIIIHVWQLS